MAAASFLFLAAILQRERERKTDGERNAGRGRGEALVPVAPWQKFEREDAQSSSQVRGEQHDQSPFGKLDQRTVGPAQESFELRLALERVRQRPEVNRQEDRERDAGNAVHERCPRARMPSHANTPITARIPVAAIRAANASSAMSLAPLRHASHSASTARKPIGTCTAHASTNAL